MYVLPNTAVTIIPTTSVPQDGNFAGLRIVRAQSDPSAAANWHARRYEFQHPTASLSEVLTATLTRKGYLGQRQRITVTLHPSMRRFVELVRYDPADPPANNYDAIGMKDAHEQTQQDFKGQKKQNKDDYKDYLLEGIFGKRPLYLP